MKLNIALISILSAFAIGFLVKTLVFPKKTIVQEIPVYVPGIAGTTDTIHFETIKEIKVPGKKEVVVDSAYYYAYQEEQDKVKRLEMYIDAITINEITTTLIDNDTIKIDVWSKTRGALLAQSADYFIKPRTIITSVKIPAPPTSGLYLGGFINVPRTSAEMYSAGATLDLHLKNKEIYSIGYSNRQVFMLGYSRRIFNF